MQGTIDFSAQKRDRLNIVRVVEKVKKVIGIHGNEKHSPGFVEDTGDTMTGDLIVVSGKGVYTNALKSAGFLPIIAYGTGNTSTPSVALTVLFPTQATTALAPAYVEGGMYYDTTLHKMRIGGAADWETVTSA